MIKLTKFKLNVFMWLSNNTRYHTKKAEWALESGLAAPALYLNRTSLKKRRGF